MYRAIVTPKETKLTIDLPEEMVGKEVEVLAFELGQAEKNVVKMKSLEEAFAFWDSMAVDMSNFKFDREEANER
jgi:hypothetical protein